MRRNPGGAVFLFWHGVFFFLGAPRPLDGGGGLQHAAVSAADLGVLDPDGTVQAAFSSFDKDGSGGLDVHEIRKEV